MRSWESGCKRVCKKCDSGFYLDSNNTCQTLPEGCLAANTDGTCNSCDTGYKLSNGACISIPTDDHCA